MKLWLLRPIDKSAEPWDRDYDKVYGFVIRAASERGARKIAASECCNKGNRAWLNPELSSCNELTAEGDAMVILRDVKNG